MTNKMNRAGLGLLLSVVCVGALACDQQPDLERANLRASDRAGTLSCPNECETVGGDVNGDGQVDISDMITILNAYQYGEEQCDLAADINGDGLLDIADTLALSLYLWQSGAPPVAPIAPGDVNGDGSVDITDVSLLPGHLYGGAPATVCQMGADANGDCEVNIADIAVLAGWVAQGVGELSSCPGA